ncbi:hypothetical protein D6C78_00244 [Aureobasidium pullulans]|uniref:Uncharacterized protein n=1 Tax=Aureobasidium pullulans TaxID=5580 RepID=A0A4T0C7C3_AURPU|nr:hypothetical protein D6C78_00244 [Aureobasidium pullulans]
MSTRTATEISKMLKNPKLADILYKIEATQELLDLQMELFKKHKAAFKRKAKEIEKGLEGGISEVGTVLKQMDKSITIQKAMIDCMEQMAKEGKEQIQRMEERQVLIEALHLCRLLFSSISTTTTTNDYQDKISTTNGSSNQPEDAQPQFMDEFMRLEHDIKHARNLVQDLQNTLAALDLKIREHPEDIHFYLQDVISCQMSIIQHFIKLNAWRIREGQILVSVGTLAADDQRYQDARYEIAYMRHNGSGIMRALAHNVTFYTSRPRYDETSEDQENAAREMDALTNAFSAL